MKNINLLGCHLLSPFPPSLRLWEPDTVPGIQQCYGTCAWIYPHKHTMAGSWAVTAHFQVGHKQGQKSVISCTTWNSDSQKKILIFEIMDWHTFVNCYGWRNLEHMWPLGPGSLAASCQILKDLHKKLRIYKKCFHIWICWGTEVMCCGRHSCFCTGTLLTSFFC